ncbi:MAG: heparin lyase I family protein [Planctomycetota bacterium]
MVPQAQANIVEQWLDDKNESRVHIDNGSVNNDANNKRQGTHGFRCELFSNWNRRAELEAKQKSRYVWRSQDQVNWYGWAMKLDGQWPSGAECIINQFPTYPTNNKNFWVNGASGNGSHIIIGRHGGDTEYGQDNRVTFVLQHQGDSDGIQVTTFDLGHIDKYKNQWFDFVMEVKWTGNSNGYLKLWIKPWWSSNWGYPKINYTGTTFWNDEDRIPYFKAGLYGGNAGSNPNATRRIWFDSYRHGDRFSYLNQVKPQ